MSTSSAQPAKRPVGRPKELPKLDIPNTAAHSNPLPSSRLNPVKDIPRLSTSTAASAKNNRKPKTPNAPIPGVLAQLRGASGLSTPDLTSQSSSRESSVRTATSPKLAPSPITASSAFKRKLEVYVDIPPSPLHRTSPAGSPLFRRPSRPFVELPLSPASQARMNIERNGMRGSPLSAKASNLNTSAATEPPFKKTKLVISNTKEKDNGDTLRCHQCAGKLIPDALVYCKSVSARGQVCRLRYCPKCLQRRYGESAGAIRIAGSQTWACPRCRGICNCSICMKSRGLKPIGVCKPGAAPSPSGSRPQQLTPGPAPAPKAAQVASTSYTVFKIPVVELQKRSWPTPSAAGPARLQIAELPVVATRPRKQVPEPKWTAVPTEMSRCEVEDMIYLREFIFRFATLMPKIQAPHFESLDEFGSLSQTTASVIVLELIDLIALETENEVEKKILREAHDKLTTAGSLPAALWAILKEMRSSLPEDASAQLIYLPDPSPVPSYLPDEEGEAEVPAVIRTRRTALREELELDNGVKHAAQLITPILALCECAMQGPSIRAEIEEGCDDRKGENRAYWAELKKENERWAEERKSMGDDENEESSSGLANGNSEGDKGKEKEKPKNKRPKVKDPEAYRTAMAAHKTNLSNIENLHQLELQGQTPRFSPLGRDTTGRMYYACSARRTKDLRRKLKAPEESVRAGMEKWGWLLAVWGPGGRTAPANNAQAWGERWWGFYEPEEIRQLAKWVSFEENLDDKSLPGRGANANPVATMASPVKRRVRDENMSGMNAGPPTRAHMKGLVKGLNEYADLLAWRLDA